MVIIEQVGGKRFKRGKRTTVKYPSQLGGYYQYTYTSKEAAMEDIKRTDRWARVRAKIKTKEGWKPAPLPKKYWK